MLSSHPDHRAQPVVPRDQPDASSPVSCFSRELLFVPSFINSIPGPRNSANKVRKSSPAISSTRLSPGGNERSEARLLYLSGGRWVA